MKVRVVMYTIILYTKGVVHPINQAVTFPSRTIRMRAGYRVTRTRKEQ